MIFRKIIFTLLFCCTTTSFMIAMKPIGEVDISEVPKRELAIALFEKAWQIRYPNEACAKPLLCEIQIKEIVSGYTFYLQGVAMLIDISGDTVDTSSYNAKNGENAAENVITKLIGAKAKTIRVNLSTLSKEDKAELNTRIFEIEHAFSHIDNERFRDFHISSQIEYIKKILLKYSILFSRKYSNEQQTSIWLKDLKIQLGT